MERGKRKLRLGDILVAQNVITPEQLERGLENQKGSGRKLGETLVDEQICTERAIAEALSSQLQMEMVDLTGVVIPEEIIKLVPVNLVKKHTAIPYMLHPDNMNVLKWRWRILWIWLQLMILRL